MDDDDDNGVDDDGDNDYKRWFRMVDGSCRRPPCSPPRRPHLPRRQGLPEEDRQSSSCLDCLVSLFYGHNQIPLCHFSSDIDCNNWQTVGSLLEA